MKKLLAISILFFAPQISFAANPPSTTGLDLSPYITSIDNVGGGIWRANFATSFFGSSACLSAFSTIGGSLFNTYYRPSGTYISAYSGTQTGGAINAAWVCTNGNVFVDNPGGGKPMIYNDVSFTGGQTGVFLYNINAGTSTSSPTLAYAEIFWDGSVASEYVGDPTITIPAGGSGTDFSYWSGSFDVGNMSASSTHWLPAIRWGIAASTSTATTTIANDSQLFYSGSTSFLIPKSSNLETGVTYWYQGRLYNTDFSGDVIATSTIEYFTITGPAPDGSDLDECGIGNLFGCIKNAFVWLLYPSQGLETSFDALIDTIQAKPPVGYFTIVSESITGLNASSTPTVEVIVPTQIKEVFFTPIDSSLGGLLWAIFAFLFYKRLKNIQL